MASPFVEASPELNQLFRDISFMLSSAESEDIVQSAKRIYGKQFDSLGDQDLFSCLVHLRKFGYVSSTKLTLLKEFVAPRSEKKKDISDAIDNFKVSFPFQAKPEKELRGRTDEIKKITEMKLKIGQPRVVNLYGSAGVGKTTVAKEVCAEWRKSNGKSYVFDLREARNVRAICDNIMETLELNVPVGHLSTDIVNIIGRIHDQIENKRESQPVLFLLDNVDQFTKGQGKEGKNLRIQFMQFLRKLSEFVVKGKTGTLNILLTSRTQLNDPESKVIDYELQPLTDSFSEKILLPMEASSIDASEKEKLLGICKGVPLLLKGTAAILKHRRKSPSDVIDVISQEEAGTPSKSKLEKDAKEKPFDLQEEGVDKGQTSIIKEMFETLPSDSLRVLAVSVSLFCGPFSASTVAIVFDILQSEAVAQLEGLVNNAIIHHVVDKEAKELLYDIHPLLRKYADSIKNDKKFHKCYTKAKKRFYEHYLSKMEMIARLIESDYVKAFNQFAEDRPNYEFAIDISLLPEYFSIPGEYHENALIASLFNAMLSGEKQTELFHSWAEMCKDDGKSGSLFRAQLRCWEARQILDVDGPRKALEVLEQASSSLGQVQDESTKSFKLTQGLFWYVEGEIYCQNRDYTKALESLKSSSDLMKEWLKLDTNLARCYNALGNCYYRLRKTEKSLEFYNKALEMREKLSGSDYHYDMPVYKNQIGTVHEDQGEYDEAVKCYKDALRLLKELKLSGYEDEALFCRNLANVYTRQGKYSQAIKPAEKAYNIRIKRLGKHPDTVRSIFQLGVIHANLRAFDKALDFFFNAWEMEKSLQAGNHSAVWKLLITGVKDMCDKLNEGFKKENFRQDALQFCQNFWEDEKVCNCTTYNKSIIETILDLLADVKEDSGIVIIKYEKEALWFYDKMYSATEETFYNDLGQETDHKMQSEMLKERNEILDNIIDLCLRLEEHEKLARHKQSKLILKEFGENLLINWQKEWEEGKRAEKTNEMRVGRQKTITAIIQLCKELQKEDLCRRYEEEALWFYDEILSATEEDFYNEFDQKTDNQVLNKTLEKRDKMLDNITDFFVQLDKHEKVVQHKRNKLTLYKKVLLRPDFVGEGDNESSVLKNKVEQLYKDLGERASVTKFQEDLLETWRKQWEKWKGEDTKEMLALRERTIKGILLLCRELKRDALHTQYEKEALWFYDGMLSTTEEDFYNEFDPKRHNKVLNDMLKERKRLLDETIHFCRRQDQREKIIKYKRKKLTLCKKVLMWVDFVGEKGHDIATLKSLVEQLYKDMGEKESILEFRENLLGIWRKQLEEGAEESKEMVNRDKTITLIIQLCKELKKEELGRRYEEEALSFYERLLEVKHTEMKVSKLKGLLRKMKDLSSSIGHREREECYRDASQTLINTGKLPADMLPRLKEFQVLSVEKKSLFEESPSASRNEEEEEEEEVEVGFEEEIEEATEETIQVETGEVIEEGSEKKLVDDEDSSTLNSGRIIIFNETVTSEGAHLDLKVGAVHLTFPPNSVSEPTSIVVYKWNCSACSPPLQEHEDVVSNVIEISTINGQALEFNADVKLFLSHSAPDLQGYEVVIKRQINKECNEWEDVNETKNLQRLADIEDEYPSSENIPDFYFPVAQADITKCSIYAVVSRLKSSPSYTITSNGGTFNHPDYPGVTVTIPQKAVESDAKFSLELKVQEVPNEEFDQEGQDVFFGPILRIICSQVLQFSKPVAIQLPVFLRDEHVGIPDPSICHVRVLFLKSDGDDEDWIEITDDLINPASFDGTFVRFQVTHFSKYGTVLHWRKKGFRISKRYYILTRNQPRRAHFFAYFEPLDHPPTKGILYLTCCPAKLRSAVMEEYKKNNRTPHDVTSKKYLVPGYHQAFIFLSGRIYHKEDVKKSYLMLECNEPYKDEMEVYLINDKDLSAKVEFRSTPEPAGKNLLARILNLKVSSLNVDRSESRPAPSGETLKVVLLANEWGSSKGGLSTINRTLAINLAKPDLKVEVTLLVPQFACTEEDKRTAQSHNISVREAQRRPGFIDPLDWLSFPPRDLTIDIVIGHGAKLGKQAQVIRESHHCKWVQVVHTAPEELAIYKNYHGAIAKGEKKKRAEIELCKLADLVVTVGPKLNEAYSSYLRFSQRDIFQLTPGTFTDFADVEQSAQDSSKFRVLTFGRGDSEDFSLKGYDIAARAIVKLKDSSYRLIVVGAPDGKQDEVAQTLLHTGISRKQLSVRSFVQDKEILKELFCEADVAIMPSRTEGFGLTALEAMSAGLPILVSENSGFGEALRGLPSGKSFVIESEEPKEWAKAIAAIRQKSRTQRLQEIQTLRKSYEEKFSWDEQCKSLVDRMWRMVYEMTV